MPVEFKDYYRSLGVARDASEADIKKAFRKLAREHHPDVARDKKTAEEKFKEINEAYEVLGDPAKRKKYDQLGAQWKSGAEFRAPPGWEGGGWTDFQGAEPGEFRFGGTGFSDFFERFFGGRGGVEGLDEVLRRAENRRRRPGTASEARGQDFESDILVTLGEVVHGSIRPVSLQRRNSQTGTVETHTFKVRIPPGVQEGQRIRVPGQGGEGSGRSGAGDLYLRVRVAAHPDFQVRGADLIHELDLAPWEAVLGANVSVPTLGSAVTVRIPPGTQNGQQLRVRGRGLPQGEGDPGDLYVVVKIETPASLTPEEQTLWEQLRQVSRFNPRKLAN
jgi:curved DNA-binding protein